MSKQFLTAPELAELVGVSLSKAYGYIRQMNGELQQKGFLTVRVKVNRSYALERFGLEVVQDGGDL